MIIHQDVKEEDVKIHVVIFMFDCLFFNGQSLLQLPLQERRRILRENIKEVPGKMQFATNMEVNQPLRLLSFHSPLFLLYCCNDQLDDTEQMQNFLMESVASGCEGLMVKTLVDNATYEPSKRSLNWLKV